MHSDGECMQVEDMVGGKSSMMDILGLERYDDLVAIWIWGLGRSLAWY